MVKLKDDNCGISPIESGDWDPNTDLCRSEHDPVFDDLVNGIKPRSSNWVTARDWMLGMTKNLGKAVYTIATFPIYFLAGPLGMVRYRQLEVKNNPPEKSDKGTLGDDLP